MDERKAARYDLEREIGRGGMGRVYRARDSLLGRTVALKMLAPDLILDADLRRRLAREARAASLLSHPAVATVYDFVEDPEKTFIVCEYIEGITLREHLNQHRFSTEEILDIGIQLADALAAAQERGITHRDLKPENIMLTAGPECPGRVKILDFGLAKLSHPVTPALAPGQTAETATASTTPGLIVGTLNYMAPEQLEGEPADTRTDLYALGLLLYEMASGMNPFVGKSPTSTIANILKLEPPPLQQFNAVVPTELDRILRKCLRKRATERYQAARELFVDLTNLRRDLASGPSPVAQPATTALLTISRLPARALFGLMQLAYMAMYAAFLYKYSEAQIYSASLHLSALWFPWLSLVGVCGLAVRLYLMTAVILDYADSGRKFRRLFPVILLLDLSWAVSPLLLLQKIGLLTLMLCAGLAYLPFSQRTLLYAAYAPSGGRTSAVGTAGSL